MKCEKLHDMLKEHYNGGIYLCIDAQREKAIYTRVGTDKKCIINGYTFRHFPLELIFTVIIVKGWLTC